MPRPYPPGRNRRPACRGSRILLVHLGQGEHGPGTLHQVELGSMGTPYVVHPAVPGQGGRHLDVHFLEVFLQDPGLTADVEFPQEVDPAGCVVSGGRVPTSLKRASQAALYPSFFVPLKPSECTGKTVDAASLRNFSGKWPQHRRQSVRRYRWSRRRRPWAGRWDQFQKGGFQLAGAPVDDVHFRRSVEKLMR